MIRIQIVGIFVIYSADVSSSNSMYRHSFMIGYGGGELNVKKKGKKTVGFIDEVSSLPLAP